MIVLALAACDEPARPTSPPPPTRLVDPEAVARPPAPASPPRETVALRWKASADASSGLFIETFADPKHRTLRMTAPNVRGPIDISLPLHTSMFAVVRPSVDADQRRIVLVAQDTGAKTAKVTSRGPGHWKRSKEAAKVVSLVVTENGMPVSDIDSQTLSTLGPVLELAPGKVGAGDSWDLNVGELAEGGSGWSETVHDQQAKATLTALQHAADGSTVAVIDIAVHQKTAGQLETPQKTVGVRVSASIRGHGEFEVEKGTWKALHFVIAVESAGMGTGNLIINVDAKPVDVPAAVRRQVLALAK